MSEYKRIRVPEREHFASQDDYLKAIVKHYERVEAEKAHSEKIAASMDAEKNRKKTLNFSKYAAVAGAGAGLGAYQGGVNIVDAGNEVVEILKILIPQSAENHVLAAAYGASLFVAGGLSFRAFAKWLGPKIKPHVSPKNVWELVTAFFSKDARLRRAAQKEINRIKREEAKGAWEPGYSTGQKPHYLHMKEWAERTPEQQKKDAQRMSDSFMGTFGGLTGGVNTLRHIQKVAPDMDMYSKGAIVSGGTLLGIAAGILIGRGFDWVLKKLGGDEEKAKVAVGQAKKKLKTDPEFSAKAKQIAKHISESVNPVQQRKKHLAQAGFPPSAIQSAARAFVAGRGSQWLAHNRHTIGGERAGMIMQMARKKLASDMKYRQGVVNKNRQIRKKH